MDMNQITAVSETLFLPLYALAMETQAAQPIVADPEAVRMAGELDRWFDGSDTRIYKRLARRQLPKLLVTTLSLRIRHFDRVARRFLARNPDGIIVSLGCGLSTRCRRVDNGRARWFLLDLPEVIDLRRTLVDDWGSDAGGRFETVAASVLDFDWLKRLPDEDGPTFLFLAEGLLMYLEEKDVRDLTARLAGQCAGAEIVAEVASKRTVRMMSGALGRSKLRREFGLSRNVWYHTGLSEPREMEEWVPGLEYLGEWNYFDEDEPRLGWMRVFAGWDVFRRAQYVVHYRLSRTEAAA